MAYRDKGADDGLHRSNLGYTYDGSNIHSSILDVPQIMYTVDQRWSDGEWPTRVMVKPLLTLCLYYLSLITISRCYQTGDKMLVPLIMELRLLAGDGVIYTYVVWPVWLRLKMNMY